MCAPHKALWLASILITVLLLSRSTPAQEPTSDSAATVVDRAVGVHGRQWTTGELSDSAAAGKLMLFGLEGPRATFDFRLLRKGMTRVHRVIQQPVGELRQGTDGENSWESVPGFFTPAAQGRAMHFLESQTTRSMQRLFNYQKEGLKLRDLGAHDQRRIIEAEDQKGKKTKYFIDSDKNLITKLEFVTREVKDPFSGEIVPDTYSYVFSDFRLILGIPTQFKIERFNGANKIEEMQFNSVRYNAGLKDADFRR